MTYDQSGGARPAANYGPESPFVILPPSKPPKRGFSRFLVPTLAGLLGLGVGTAVSGDNGSDEPVARGTVTTAPVAKTSPRVAPTKPVKLKASFEDGTWLVGRDITAGTYTTEKEVSGTCYWERHNPKKDGASAIIANGFPGGGKPTVTLRNGEEFRTMDCGAWSRA